MSKVNENFRVFLMVVTFFLAIGLAVNKIWIAYLIVVGCFTFEIIEAKVYLAKKER